MKYSELCVLCASAVKVLFLDSDDLTAESAKGRTLEQEILLPLCLCGEKFLSSLAAVWLHRISWRNRIRISYRGSAEGTEQRIHD
jgi:hypothetical protein